MVLYRTPMKATIKIQERMHFRVNCRAEGVGEFGAPGELVVVTVGQKILRRGTTEVWESVGVYAKEEADGTLSVRVVVFNPDWDEPLQIACIRSRPHDPGCLTPLGCCLDHIA
jgi:hypothetical protein